MSKKIRTTEVDHLFDAILTLENNQWTYGCPVLIEGGVLQYELLSITQRYEVAKMLREGHTYLDISNATGASTATISRVNRSLNYGNDGYDMVLERVKKIK